MATTEQIDWNHWIIRLIAFIIDGIIFGYSQPDNSARFRSLSSIFGIDIR